MNDFRRAMPVRDSYSPIYGSCHRHEAPRETISISIDGGASSIVLPRGHDLVKHLERLMPDLTAVSHHESPTTVAHHPTSSFRFPAMNQLPMDRPHSPYHSDSSVSSAAYRASTTADQAASGRHTGYRRRRGAAGYAAPTGKKCQIDGCQKISVSRGLCRGHGGGRRCQYSGCTKGAQSRSDFCWAHGGGQRCEVKNCMRSRKSKRFCVAHLSWEDHVAPADAVVASVDDYHHRNIDLTPKPLMPRVHALELHQSPPRRLGSPSLFNEHKLPSLQQALRKNLYDNTPEPTQRFHHHHHPSAVYGVIG